MLNTGRRTHRDSMPHGHHRRRSGRGRLRVAFLSILLLTVAAAVGPLSGPVSASAASFSPIAKGDLVASLGTGDVNEYAPDGTLVQTLATGLNAPTGSAFDGSGNLYVTEFGTNDIVKINGITGAQTVFSDNTILGDASSFNSPESIAFGPGYTKMYVSDANRNGPGGGIHVLDPATGKALGFLSLPTSSGSAGAGESDWLAFDKSGSLFMTNENPAQGIMQVDLSGGDIVQPSLVANLPDDGYALSFDSGGNIWLGDTTSVLEYTSSGTLIRTITNPDFSQLFAAAFNPPFNTVYMGDLNTGSIFTYDLAGNLLGSFNAGAGIQGLSVAGTAVAPPPPPSGRYVALGDSIAYGHGLANPGKTSKGGLPPDMSPSVLAYPSLVASQLGFSMNIRSDGCTLTGDQLAVSGAPSIANTWTGKDTNCHYTGPVPTHKAIFPQEIAAARFSANPASLVTLQAGADDLNFAGCLEALLGAPAQFGAENCVTGKAGNYQLTSRAKSELDSLTTGLLATINSVHRRSPGAQIALIDYYQIVPEANAPLTGTSIVCKDLRAARPGGAWRTAIRSKANFVQDQLNGTIKAVAARYPDVLMVDIGSLFEGHELCTSPRWLFDGAWDAAHPNQTGQQQIANAIVSRCGTLPKMCRGR